MRSWNEPESPSSLRHWIVLKTLLEKADFFGRLQNPAYCLYPIIPSNNKSHQLFLGKWHIFALSHRTYNLHKNSFAPVDEWWSVYIHRVIYGRRMERHRTECRGGMLLCWWRGDDGHVGLVAVWLISHIHARAIAGDKHDLPANTESACPLGRCLFTFVYVFMFHIMCCVHFYQLLCVDHVTFDEK